MFENLTQPPDPYILLLMGLGLLIALVAWLPLALRRLPLSLPIVCIGLGIALGAIPWFRFAPSPLDHPGFTERFAEFVVIIALMGAGLKIDRVLGLRSWLTTWRLIFLTLPLSIVLITLLAGTWLALPWALALLLGAVLAPTDPVLASDVQVGPPKTGEEDEVRFALTSEAGVNDGAAFPFVHLAIALAASSVTQEPWLLKWLTYNVLWEIGAGLVGGYLIGRLFGWITFHIPAETKLARTGDGLIALSATFVSYGVTETINCYGFLSVFVTALTFRQAHRSHDFHKSMHDLTEQIERISMMVLLLFFGGALVHGLLAPLQPVDVAAAGIILLVIRPLTGLIGLAGIEASWHEKLTIAFFGIRGIGSFYYLAYGLNHVDDATYAARLWAIVGLVVLLSILMHGLSVTPIMRKLDRLQGRDPDADDAVPPPGFQGPGGETR
ncbi:cation:proton antiporter [Cereibacter sphaeroides]|uniref:cation:proton antiporter n=1 Tax=Cereibacter sphaeroides TaxID=1063 RepID=UPI001F3092E7|nr:cation:proton antiporter [Cereibacter sphaeroides]MCE6951519.1 cation:proton antiporter [Cereibacter sphaeroides]MCE6960844.1 cation:proton antiporter [Cereibacter sphaeroides]MCE6969890.1 cation:proton antiporter [Cereibacter sphaeroides]MCE6974278.1 cation:proton antiporter [Cereibacter sphaeroides]